MTGRRVLLSCVAFAGLIALGCSSDAFGPVGRSLPPEVTQDSLDIEVSLPITLATSFEPDGEASEYAERRALVFGRRLRDVLPERSDWRASMLMRFDFSENVESLPLPPVATWKGVSIVLQRFKDDSQRNRDIEIFTLAAPLDSTMRSGPVDDLLDQRIYEEAAGTNVFDRYVLLGDNSTAGSVDTLSAIYGQLKGWLTGAPHNGVAIVDRSTSYPDTLEQTLIRFASDDLLRSQTSLLPPLAVGTVWQPHLAIAYDDPATEFDDVLHYRPSLDLTHVEREEPASDRIRLGTHPNYWAYLDFDLGSVDIPTNATITEAYVSLHVDAEFSLLRGAFNVRAAEATLAGASSMTLADIQRNAIARSLTSVSTEDVEVRIDVTEFVQRFINGLLDDDAGILLVQTSTNYDLVRSLEFFSTDAADPALRPRLFVEFTPPPDFQR